MKLSIYPVVLFAAVACISAGAGRTQADDTQVVVDGVGVFPLDEQTWRSPVMAYPQRVTDADRRPVGPDFFEAEYGQPCDFRQGDLLAQFGFTQKETLPNVDPMPRSTGQDYRIVDGQMVFTVGRRPFVFGFGQRQNEMNVPSIRLGASWQPNMKDRFRLYMNLDQDRPTKWVFRAYSTSNSTMRQLTEKFEIPQTGQQTFEFDLGFVRKLFSRPVTGISLECTTPGATVKIQSVRIAPSSADIYFRKQFTLAHTPVIAQATYQTSPLYELYINGRKVDAGNGMYLSLGSGQQKTIDLRPYLKEGVNTIAFRNEFVFWAGLNAAAQWLFEGVAIDAQGNIQRILADREWKCYVGSVADDAQANAAPAWAQADFDDSSWLAPRLGRNAVATHNSGTPVSRGYNPAHMGCLQVTPHQQAYPLFEIGQPPRFDVQLPAKMPGDVTPFVEVYRAGTDELIETATPTGRQNDADGKLAEYAFELQTRKVGPYRLMWKLRNAAGETIETSRGEMVIVGPIEQEQWTVEDFDARFDQRLKLVRHIDCTQPFGDASQYIDHSGMYQPTQMNQSAVVEQDDMRYRETGPGTFSYFGYNVTFPKLGVPYVIELVIPDNAQRTIYSGVIETHPVPYRNNPNAMGRFASTGGWLTGGDLPVSDKFRRVRFVHYPTTQEATVLVMNGRRDQARAATSAINIYQIEGGLPAMKTPATKRLLGTFNERMNLSAETVGCENPMENDPVLMLNAHRDSWYNWYRIIERKIRLLRYQGRNFTVEGLYMYDWGHYPSSKYAVGAGSSDFDAARLAFKMYQYNGIRCMIGLEYMCSPQILASGIDKTSDRQMWEGAPTVQLVDKFGRQMADRKNSGVNFLSPAIRQDFLGLTHDVYERYRDCPSVMGASVVMGAWYLGGFARTSHDELGPLDVGYSDVTVGLFEDQTGIRLNLSARDPQRFAKRFDALAGEYREPWIAWRQEQVQAFLEETADTMPTWKLWVYPSFKHQNLDLLPEYKTPTLHEEKVNHGMANFLAEAGLSVQRYIDNARIRLIAPLVTVGFKSRVRGEHELDHLTWNMNPGAQQIVQQLQRIFLNTALDEIDCPADDWKESAWKGTRRAVFVPRGANELATAKWVDAVTQTVPEMLITQWMDVNMETGHSDAIRRFARAFYATPEVAFEPLPAAQVHGVFAQFGSDPSKENAGGVCLRLVNDSPYPLAGVLDFSSAGAGAEKLEIDDMIHDQPLAMSAGVAKVAMQPYEMRLFRVDAAQAAALQCRFAYEPDVTQAILAQAQRLIAAMPPTLPAAKAEALRQAFEAKDAFKLYRLLHDYDVIGGEQIMLEREHAMANQNKLLADLKTQGVAFINCANPVEYTSPDGARWLPDQAWCCDDAYGQTGANFADRGDMAIADTREDRIYQTEAYGDDVTYQIPLPNGVYNVGLHVAETYPPNKQPQARLFQIEVQGKAWPKIIDLFVLCGGFAKAHVIRIDDVQVSDGKLVIHLTGQVGIQGIEIRPRNPAFGSSVPAMSGS